jgi:dihydroorotate dehydrogenase (NAD+) catalytic subunit
MINLAPHNKLGLLIASPLIAGSGAVGYGDAWPPGLKPDDFGLIITAPISATPRKGKAQPRLAEIPAGFLLETGDHNPGFRRVLASHAKTWRRLQTPVVLSLAGGEPGDRAWMAAHLDEVEDVIAGVELPIAETVNLSEAAAIVAAVRRATPLPILARLPVTRAAYLARTCQVAGADALIVGTPPPAAYPASDGWVEAPVGGPVALPFTLRALRQLAELNLDAPIVAAGGVRSLDDALLCLEMGASAVQIRSLVWRDPAAAHRLALNIRHFLPEEEQD